MIFRWRKAEVAAEAKNGDLNLALIPLYQGKNKSDFGNRIAKIIQKSSFCSSSPLAKRIIIKNVEVCCIVIETSGAKSVKIICASLPYMINLISKTSPKFKAVLEDERVVNYIKFFKEIDLESLLYSVCSATIIIHKGVTRWYPVICVQLGREAFFFGKNVFQYLLHLFLEGIASTLHYVCEDLPHLLQSLCAQNYAVAKYFVENLPYIALGGAKNFVLFTLLLQRSVNAGLKLLKRLVKFFRRILFKVSAKIDVIKVFSEIYNYLKSFIIFITTGETYSYLKSSFIRFLQWLAPILKQAVPTLYSEIKSFIKKLTPFLQNILQFIVKAAPKVYKFCEDNMVTLIYVCNAVEHFVKCVYDIIKPYLQMMYHVIQISAENLPQTLYFLLDTINKIFSYIKNMIRYFILDNPHVANFFHLLLIQINEVYPILLNFTFDGYHILVDQLKFIVKQLLQHIPSIVSCMCKVSQDIFYLLQEFFPFFKPAIAEISSIAYHSSKEIANKSFVGMQRVLPSIWCGLKTVTPVTFRATYDIVATTKSSAVIIYPKLLEAAVVISPELSRCLIIIIQDSSKACREVTNVSYVASQEVFLAARYISTQLPTILKAVSEVSVTTSVAVIEIISTSSKGGNRVWNDLYNGLQAVNSAYNLAEIELRTMMNETISEINNNISDNEEVQEVLILLSKSSDIILTLTTKHFFSAYQDISSRFIASGTHVVLEGYSCLKSFNINLLINLIKLVNYALTKSSIVTALNKSASLPTDHFLKRMALYIVIKFSEGNLNAFAAFYEYFIKLCREISMSSLSIIPRLWEDSKLCNEVIWQHFCNLSSDLWSLTEVAVASAWDATCTYTPEIWDFMKVFSFRTWELTCDVSPVVWKSIAPLFPILWSSNREVVQCIWQFHVKTCNSTWRIIIPVSSTSWECMVNNFPKAWFILCENSKSQWNTLCSAVESSWNTVTQTSSLSWDLFHKTISKSWKHAVRPATKSTCYSATSAVTKSVKLSYKVCLKTKKLMFFL